MISTDFYPTLLDMAGLPQRPRQHVDGESLAPLLKQQGELKREALYWHFPNYIGPGHPDGATPCSVIRRGDWKLIEFFEDDRAELYNLKDDIGEQHDLAAKKPDQVKQLRRMLKQWREQARVQMPKPNPKYSGE